MDNDQIFDKARAKHDAKKFGEAIKLYQMVLIKNPKHLDANYLLGTAYAEIGKLDGAKKYLLKAESLMPHSPFIKVNLGNIYKEQGDFESAFVYFIRALEIQHDLSEARQNLGVVIGLMEEGKSETAATCCLEYGLSCICAGRNDEALAIMVVGNHLYPENAHIRYFMTILENNLPDKELQEEFVQQEFDKIAPFFDEKLTEVLQYNVPNQLAGMLKDNCGADIHFTAIADLGCGTGLSGEVFKSFSETVTGIDLSEKMLEVARTKAVYNNLIQGDIVRELELSNQKFDLFIAADVFIYVGELAGCFNAVVAKANPGALFVFSTESSTSEEVTLQLSGRYAHSHDYITKIVNNSNCSIIDSREIQLRKEGEGWIVGEMYCVKMA